MKSRDHKPAAERRELVARPTAMADALVSCLNKAGVDTSAARIPLKREPTWRVSRKIK